MKLNNRYTRTLLLAVVSFGIFTACQPDEFEDSNGLGADGLNASFTVTPAEDQINTYILRAETENVLGVKWDKLGSGTTVFGRTIDTVYYPDAGTYDVTLEVIGIGGKTASATNTITVPTSDPVAGNLIVGSKMEAGDEQFWSIIQISAGVNMEFQDGKLLASGGGWGHAAVYQPIQVEAGRKYKVDLQVSGSGATETWFEVYIGKLQPTNGSDYSDGGIRISLNTWAGCGTSAFDGKLSELACGDNDLGALYEATETGTVYVLIKTGGADLGESGIAIDNVEFRGTTD